MLEVECSMLNVGSHPLPLGSADDSSAFNGDDSSPLHTQPKRMHPASLIPSQRLESH